MLAKPVEDDGSSRHVDADSESLRGEEDLDEASGEEDFNDLFQNREEASVVNGQAFLA